MSTNAAIAQETVATKARIPLQRAAVLECLNNQDIVNVRVKRIGIADIFVEHGPQKQLRSIYGVDAAAIVKTARQLLEK